MYQFFFSTSFCALWRKTTQQLLVTLIFYIIIITTMIIHTYSFTSLWVQLMISRAVHKTGLLVNIFEYEQWLKRSSWCFNKKKILWFRKEEEKVAKYTIKFMNVQKINNYNMQKIAHCLIVLLLSKSFVNSNFWCHFNAII